MLAQVALAESVIARAACECSLSFGTAGGEGTASRLIPMVSDRHEVDNVIKTDNVI